MILTDYLKRPETVLLRQKIEILLYGYDAKIWLFLHIALTRETE
jgi:hypothetical protein